MASLSQACQSTTHFARASHAGQTGINIRNKGQYWQASAGSFSYGVTLDSS
jgi:hypothetical protein